MQQLQKLESEGKRRDGSGRLCTMSLGRAECVLQRTVELWQIRPSRSKNGHGTGAVAGEVQQVTKRGAQ